MTSENDTPLCELGIALSPRSVISAQTAASSLPSDCTRVLMLKTQPNQKKLILKRAIFPTSG